MVTLGKHAELKDLQAVWFHGTEDFPPWLSKERKKNLLVDTVGRHITGDETGPSVGVSNEDFFVQKTGTGRMFLIKNQFKDTNHDHLTWLIDVLDSMEKAFKKYL